MTSEQLSAIDRHIIAETVTGVGFYCDVRQWDRVVELLADEVCTDYTSLFGGEPTTAAADALVGQWRSTLAGFDATQHLITNVQVDGSGDEATAQSHVRATHWLDDRSWTVGGVYTHHLERSGTGWRVAYMRIDRLYEEGDRSVLQDAAART
jgi:hypothetical protein